MKRHFVAILLFAVFSMSLHAQTSSRRDGNWWNQEDKLEKLAYVTGFFDGMDLGRQFSYWGMLKDEKQAGCASEAGKSFDDYETKFMSNVTNDQIADGLDIFYKDYRNRSIKVADAVWLVLNSIAGMPQDRLDTMIENWRKNAARN